MPLYEYHCVKCGETFEKLVSLRDRTKAPACPECSSKKVERLVSSFAVGGPSSGQSSLGSNCPTGTCNLDY